MWLLLDISEAEIISSVRSQRGSCAAGIDGLYMDMFKCTLEVVLPYIKKLFNIVLNTGRYRTKWSENMSTPVHKKVSVTIQTIIRQIGRAHV